MPNRVEWRLATLLQTSEHILYEWAEENWG